MARYTLDKPPASGSAVVAMLRIALLRRRLILHALNGAINEVSAEIRKPYACELERSSPFGEDFGEDLAGK